MIQRFFIEDSHLRDSNSLLSLVCIRYAKLEANLARLTICRTEQSSDNVLPWTHSITSVLLPSVILVLKWLRDHVTGWRRRGWSRGAWPFDSIWGHVAFNADVHTPF